MDNQIIANEFSKLQKRIEELEQKQLSKKSFISSIISKSSILIGIIISTFISSAIIYAYNTNLIDFQPSDPIISSDVDQNFLTLQDRIDIANKRIFNMNNSLTIGETALKPTWNQYVYAGFKATGTSATSVEYLWPFGITISSIIIKISSNSTISQNTTVTLYVNGISSGESNTISSTVTMGDTIEVLSNDVLVPKGQSFYLHFDSGLTGTGSVMIDDITYIISNTL